MNIKHLCLLLMLGCLGALSAASNTLNMSIDYNRFLNAQKKTILVLDYQVPYRNLLFQAGQNGYFAELQVRLELYTADSLAFAKDITDNIGIRTRSDAVSSTKNYLNRLSLLMDDPAYTLKFLATDVNSQKSFAWTFEIRELDPGSLLSDIELDAVVRADTLQYLSKFRRNGVLYQPEPSALINKSLQDSVYLYFEIYRESNYAGKYSFNLKLERDTLTVINETRNIQPLSDAESLALKLPLQNLKPGRHKGYLTLSGDGISEERSFEFVLMEDTEAKLALMPNPDDEYTLMRYFLSSQLPGHWYDLDNATKQRYITQFWRNMALKTGLSLKEVMDMVQERIDYCNKYFGHHKPGWTTDMGRIYIRNGAPDEIDRDTSSDQSRFVRKDYQIWKYSTQRKPVYVFIDIQMSGNYRLIYADDDDMENSDPDWLRFLGADFDTNRLEN